MTLFKTVMTNGCYDCLHFGHIQLIQYARSLGDVLIIAIDGDKRVKEMKGEGRPVNSSLIRGKQLDAIKGVALVVEFETDEELENWIKELQVDILVVGSEYEGKRVVGSELVKEVKYFEKIPGFSTTSLIERNNY